MITLAPHLPEVQNARATSQARASQNSPKPETKASTDPRYKSERSGAEESSIRTVSGRGSEDAEPLDTANDKSSTLITAALRLPSAQAIVPNSSEDNQSEPGNLQPFHAAWSRALLSDDMTGVVPHTANLAGSQQAAQALKLSRSRINPDAIAVLLPANPPETMPTALAFPVPITSTSATNRSGSNNPLSPLIENPNNSDAEAPVPSTDPVAFTVHMRNPDEPAFEVVTGKSQNSSIESQAVIVTAEPTVDPNAAQQIAQAYAQPGAGAEFAPAPGPVPRAPVQPIETPPIAPTALPPVKDIALNLGGPQNIEIRVSEKSGEIRVDVRTADPNLAQDLRGGLHELTSKLDSKGFTTAVSSPSENTFTAARSGDAELSQDHSSGQQQNSAQQDEQQKQQQSRNQEAWSKRNQDSWFSTLSNYTEDSQ